MTTYSNITISAHFIVDSLDTPGVTGVSDSGEIDFHAVTSSNASFSYAQIGFFAFLNSTSGEIHYFDSSQVPDADIVQPIIARYTWAGGNATDALVIELVDLDTRITTEYVVVLDGDPIDDIIVFFDTISDVEDIPSGPFAPLTEIPLSAIPSISVEHVDVIEGGGAADSINGGELDDVIDGRGGDDLIAGGAGKDTIIGRAGADIINGNAGDDHIEGGSGTDILRGDSGDDDLSGGGGADTLRGGTGNDTIEGGAGADRVLGGGGTDTASYDGSSSGVRLNLTVGTGTGGNASGDVFASIENVVGSRFADILIGSAGNNTIEGGRGADELRGSAGNDMLEGGGGGDILNGGSGVDTASYTTATSGVTLSLATGGTGGNANGDTFFRVENVIGSGFDDVIRGDGGANAINGGRGDDIIRGGSGDDAITGGRGNDTMYGGGGDDEFVFRANNGDDTIVAFNASADSIRFAISGLEYSDLVFSEEDGSAVIDYGSGTITLDGISEETAVELVFDFG